jgi:hypothetical protein
MRCVVLQPSYIPWRGYFHQIRLADIFVFYDDVQYDKHGWRNRNRIKTPNGTQWLTVPVRHKGNVSEHIPIDEIRISDDVWRRKHLLALQQAYRRAPHFADYEALLESFFGQTWRLLADLTIETTIAISRELGITSTRFVRSSSLEVGGFRLERLLAVLRAVGATHYLSGPAARSYLDPAAFEAAGVTLEYMTYDYPEYPQLYPPFEPRVSILDLLLMTGGDAPRYIWGSDPARET